jgi:hypothetical protein
MALAPVGDAIERATGRQRRRQTMDVLAAIGAVGVGVGAAVLFAGLGLRAFIALISPRGVDQ